MTRMRSVPIALACAIGCLAAFPGGSTSAPVPKGGTTPYIKWTVTSDPVTNEMHDPLAVKDLVVVGTDKGALRAYRAGTGEFAWEYNCGKRIFHHPSSDGERIYFTVDSSLTAVTADAGIKVWDFDMRESRCWSRSH